ncbi:MAG: hypothetical protein AAGF44_02765 [Pseudomonadota bacterium]
MPLDRLVLYIVAGIAVLVALSYLVAVVIGAVAIGPLGLVVLIPVAVVAYIAIRIIRERVGNAEDDYYDRIER